ncbi:MAG TPA: zf-HC2 domain-containing protein, partial [Steroidobacteraceae bacterium]
MIPNHIVCAEHQEIYDLMPWYVNGSIAEADRQKVEAHVRTCAACREDLEQERRVYRAMADDTGLEYMPTASFKRLQASLGAPPPEAAVDARGVDASAVDAPAVHAPAVARDTGSRRTSRIPRWPPRL